MPNNNKVTESLGMKIGGGPAFVVGVSSGKEFPFYVLVIGEE